ncbi:hypothetical protein Btru_053745 [Bulinus truncatus]|nr:hypothetical protein Btru_053745 [Bulinus truncatus]
MFIVCARRHDILWCQLAVFLSPPTHPPRIPLIVERQHPACGSHVWTPSRFNVGQKMMTEAKSVQQNYFRFQCCDKVISLGNETEIMFVQGKKPVHFKRCTSVTWIHGHIGSYQTFFCTLRLHSRRPVKVGHAISQSHPCHLTKSSMPSHKVSHAISQSQPCHLTKSAIPSHKVSHAFSQSQPCHLTKSAMPSHKVSHAVSQSQPCHLTKQRPCLTERPKRLIGHTPCPGNPLGMTYNLTMVTIHHIVMKGQDTGLYRVVMDRGELYILAGEVYILAGELYILAGRRAIYSGRRAILSGRRAIHSGRRAIHSGRLAASTDKGNVFFKYIKFTGTFEDNSRTFVCRANTSGNIVHSEPIMINIAIIPKAPRIFGPTTVVPGEEKTWICVSEGGSFFIPQVSFLDKADQKVQEKYGVTWTETETTDVFPHENYVYTRVLSITMSITEFPYTLVCEVVHPALKNEVSQRFSMRIEQEADSAVTMSKHALITSAQRVDVLDNTRRSQCQVALMSNVDNVQFTGQVVVNTTWAWREFLQVAGVYVELSSGFAGNLCFLKLDKKFCSEKPSSQSGNCYCKGFNSRNSEYIIVVNFTAKAPFSKAKLSIWWGDHQFERSQISMLPLILDSKKHVCVGFQMSESNKLNYLGLNSGKGHSLKAKLACQPPEVDDVEIG